MDELMNKKLKATFDLKKLEKINSTHIPYIPVNSESIERLKNEVNKLIKIKKLIMINKVLNINKK